MYRFLFIQFIRTTTCQIGLSLLLVIGIVSLINGRQFLTHQQEAAEEVITKQQEHIDRHIHLHEDDLSLLLYYLKFPMINASLPLAGLSIGQKDLTPSVMRVKMLTLEGQKYETDLINPVKLLHGNLDLSFVIIFIFPLLVIAFVYNLLSEEKESGTWRMISITTRSKGGFLFAKLMVRLSLLLGIMLLLFVLSLPILNLSWSLAFLLFVSGGLLYLLLWFALAFWVISWGQNSNFNALTLFTTWLATVILIPAMINNHINTKYPLPEAMATMLEQRDGYHQKWDTNKRESMEKFYADYPQFKHFGYPDEEGFDWAWYYAIQHLGDVESREESKAMQQKIRARQAKSAQWSMIIPSLYTQLIFNTLAETGMTNYMNFLKATSNFHEDIRLYFYPIIFSKTGTVDQVDWSRFKPSFYQEKTQGYQWISMLAPLIIGTVFFALLAVFFVRKL